MHFKDHKNKSWHRLKLRAYCTYCCKKYSFDKNEITNNSPLLKFYLLKIHVYLQTVAESRKSAYKKKYKHFWGLTHYDVERIDFSQV